MYTSRHKAMSTHTHTHIGNKSCKARAPTHHRQTKQPNRHKLQHWNENKRNTKKTVTKQTHRSMIRQTTNICNLHTLFQCVMFFHRLLDNIVQKTWKTQTIHEREQRQSASTAHTCTMNVLGMCLLAMLSESDGFAQRMMDPTKKTHAAPLF